MNFECHITVPLAHKQIALNTTADRAFAKWHNSEIKRDPVLGKASYFYLTAHSDNYISLYTQMKALVGALSQDGANVVREKIELIMYDTKTKDRN